MENNSSKFKNLIAKGENEELAFLPSFDLEKIAQTICGLLNAKGGRLVIGIDQNKNLVGIPNDVSVEEAEQYLVQHIVPETPFDANIEIYNGQRFMIVRVWEGSKQPYIFEGTIYFRRGIHIQKATSEEIASLIHTRQQNELHWERQVSFGVEWEDLDQKLIRKIMQTSQKNRRSNYEGEDLLEFLNHYGLFNNGSFTNACVILFAKNPIRFLPQARVRLTEYAEGKTDKSLIRDEVLEGNLFSIRERLEQYVQNLGTKSIFDEKHWQRVDFAYPEKALQEGIINALIHRDYSRFNSQMTLSVYPDKLTIANSGNLPDDINIRDLKTNHRSFPVNPDIAHMVFLIGYIDKLGRGTLKILEECKEAGLPTPVWKQSKGEVILTFHGPKTDTPKAGALLNNDAIKRLNDAVSDAVSDAVKERLILVIKLLYIEGPLTLKALMDSLNVSRATIQRDLLLLNSHHLLQRIGSDKYREYEINDALKQKFDALKN